LKIAAKPLQINTWLLLAAYNKSPAPYPIVPSPTPYNLRFSYNIALFAYHMTLQSHPRYWPWIFLSFEGMQLSVSDH